ncbi:hypothetical protein JK628_15295 [Shewanella sp. KX20019]|uniref:hypothetical protein n=1 Tax=Shewanella sp. KX20019 TaxID=2803864 RepID=UPI00192884E0|nr:hypothetical protein [Shewanella sp. KX20019]QQX78920.1 hypothetical protein JK628_15295 [Shewanella sp. KX20019]
MNSHIASYLSSPIFDSDEQNDDLRAAIIILFCEASLLGSDACRWLTLKSSLVEYGLSIATNRQS